MRAMSAFHPIADRQKATHCGRSHNRREAPIFAVRAGIAETRKRLCARLKGVSCSNSPGFYRPAELVSSVQTLSLPALNET